MAFQLLLGLPWLAEAIGAFLVSLITFLATHFTKRVAIISAVLAALLALTVAFVAAIEALLSVAQYSAPSFLSGAFFILPSNFSACIGVIISAKVLAWVYQWNRTIIEAALHT